MQDVPRDMKSIGEVIAMGDHIMQGYKAASRRPPPPS